MHKVIDEKSPREPLEVVAAVNNAELTAPHIAAVVRCMGVFSKIAVYMLSEIITDATPTIGREVNSSESSN